MRNECIISFCKNNRYSIILACVSCLLDLDTRVEFMMSVYAQEFYQGLSARVFLTQACDNIMSVRCTASYLELSLRKRLTKKQSSQYRIVCPIPASRETRWPLVPGIPIKIYTSGLQRQISIFGQHWQLGIEK